MTEAAQPPVSPAEHPAKAAPTPLQRALPVLGLIALLAVMIGTGLLGLDLGHHWDEPINIAHVSHSIRTNVLLPTFYNYPSVTYWLIWAALAPKMLTALGSHSFSLLAFSESDAFLLQARALFLVVSALAVVWVFLLVRAWRSKPAEALLAAALLGLSWEVAYHSRWVAPDTVMMQLGALAMLFIMLAMLRPERARTWLRLGAIGAGLTTGTKYTAGLLLVPLLLAAVMTLDRKRPLRGLILPAAELLAIFGGVYLITTPGTVIDPVNFAGSLRFQQSVYGSGHEVYTVQPGLPHLGRIAVYLGLDLFSHYRVLGGIVTLLALFGGYEVFRRSPKVAAVYVSFPLLYVLYFGLTSRVMIVRNLIVVAPFLAVLAAIGAGALYERVPGGRPGRLLAAALMAGLLAVNAGWLFGAAMTIRNQTPAREAQGLAAYAGAHPGQHFLLTGTVLEDLAEQGVALPPNAEAMVDSDHTGIAVFTARDVLNCFQSNAVMPSMRWIGPYEMNYRYYTSWQGRNRILIVPLQQIEQVGARSCLYGE